MILQLITQTIELILVDMEDEYQEHLLGTA